jgi:hypothetical protein
MNHTKLPWKVDETSWYIQIIDYDGIYVSTVDSINNPEANAELIVRAVNNHERLLEGCKEALGAMTAYKISEYTRSLLKQAIAEAEKND